MVNSNAKKVDNATRRVCVLKKSKTDSFKVYILALKQSFFSGHKTAGQTFLAKLLPLVFFALLTTNNLLEKLRFGNLLVKVLKEPNGSDLSFLHNWTSGLVK